MRDLTFIEQFSSQYAWNQVSVKRKFHYKKQLNKGMLEKHRLALTLGGVIDRAIDDVEGLQSSDYSTYQVFEKDNLVFKLIDLENIKTSRVGYVPRRGIMSPAYIRLEKTSKDAFSKFYYWFFYGVYINNIFNGMGGGVRQSLTQSDLLEFPIPVPDIDTQKSIANFLDRETARIDKLIEKKERLLSLMSSRIEALVDKAVLDKNVPRIRFENVVRRMQRFVLSSDHDEVVRLGLYNRGRGIFKKPSANEDEIGDSNFFYVKAGDLIISGQFAWEGAVAIATQEEEGCVVSHRYPVYRGRDGVNTGYLLGFLRSKPGDFILNEVSRGSAGRNRPLNTRHLGKEKIPIPSIELQKEISQAIDFEYRLKKKTKKSIELLKEFRSSLITEVVTGHLNIRK